MGLGVHRFMNHFNGRVDLKIWSDHQPLCLNKIREAKSTLFERRVDKEHTGMTDILIIAPESLACLENSIRDLDNNIALQDLKINVIEGIPYEICGDLPYMKYIDKEKDYTYYERSNYLVTRYNVVCICSMEGYRD